MATRGRKPYKANTQGAGFQSLPEHLKARVLATKTAGEADIIFASNCSVSIAKMISDANCPKWLPEILLPALLQLDETVEQKKVQSVGK